MQTTAPKQILTLPPHYKPSNAEVWGYTPSTGSLLTAAGPWAQQFGITHAATDKRKVHLVLIDGQNDFTLPQGTLYVGGQSGTGAIEDCKRTAEFIYRELGNISQITPTLDTHVPFQIFFPSFWVDSSGNHPAEHTEVHVDDILSGRLQPDSAMAQLSQSNYPWLLDYVTHYCRQLAKDGKYTLYLWPFHCQLGTVGHALNGVLAEAIAFHSFTRYALMAPQIKGNSPFTENYSVLGPEVEKAHDGRSMGQKNTRFIDDLLSADYTVMLGQAASHCVASSIDDFLDQILARDPALASKVYVVRDCMSAVAVPDGKGGFFADFTPQAEAALKKFADHGMHVVESTTPMADWPDMKL